MVENLSVSAGDTGLLPDPGRFRKSQQWSPCAATAEPELRACSPQQETPPQWEARAPQLEEALAQKWRLRAAKKKKKTLKSEGLTIFDLKPQTTKIEVINYTYLNISV